MHVGKTYHSVHCRVTHCKKVHREINESLRHYHSVLQSWPNILAVQGHCTTPATRLVAAKLACKGQNVGLVNKRANRAWEGPRRRAHHRPCAAQSEVKGPGTNTKDANPELGTRYDEPELAVLLVACGIGLATGAGVVLFNKVIHIIREGIWAESGLADATGWDYWARDLPLSARWSNLLLPPALGGLAVGILRKLSGGFENPKEEQRPSSPDQKQQQQQPRQIAADLQRSASSLASTGTSPNSNGAQPTSSSAPSSQQDQPSTRASGSSPGSSSDSSNAVSSRPNSNHEASTSGSDTVWSLPWVMSGSQGLQRRMLSAVRPVLKATAAAVTLGTGNSLGPEGPSVEIGRSTARGMGTVLKSKQRRLLSLVAAGSGAGVAAGFNAPISGVFFAVETVLQAQGSEDLRRTSGDTTPGLTIAMVLLASVLAAIVSQAGLGQAPAVQVPDYQLQGIWELPLILVFGACCGLVSASFTYSNQVTVKLFKQIADQGVPPVVMPAIGGSITGLVAVQYPEVLYQGFGNVNAILQNRDHFPPLLLFQILAVKILCTSVSKGSGLVGGTYAPSIFMGATLGSAFAGAAHMITAPFGVVAAAPQGYALVGVAAMLAANCQVPLTAVLLLFELTQDYYVILPTLGAVGISYWVASLPGATSAFTPSKFQESDQNSGGPVEDSGYMDALKITSQLGLDVAGEANLPESSKDEANPALADFGKFNGQREVVSVGSNGSSKEVAIDPAYRNAARNQLLNSMDTNAETLEGVSVACALEEACVLLSTDTSMTEALSIMDEVDQKVALVTSEEGAVVGVLTRESIVKQLARSPNASVQKITE